jgi:ABC-type glutathione transport system ATPase component
MDAELQPVLQVEGVTFRHERGGTPEVDDVSFILHAGKTFGVLGGNECGKTTLAQLLLGNLAPAQGVIKVFGTTRHRQQRGLRWQTVLRSIWVVVLLAALCPHFFALDLLGATMGGGRPLLEVAMVLMTLDVAQLIHARFISAHSFDRQLATGWASAESLRHGIAYISSEHDAGQKLPPHKTIEEVISQHMPLPASARTARRHEVQAALEASGFQMYTESGTPVGNPKQYIVSSLPAIYMYLQLSHQFNRGMQALGRGLVRMCAFVSSPLLRARPPQSDGVKCGELSGGQRHLVYMLSVLASRPRLLICDECLSGLDIDRQSSMLQLLQKLQVWLAGARPPVSHCRHRVRYPDSLTRSLGMVNRGLEHACLRSLSSRWRLSS